MPKPTVHIFHTSIPDYRQRMLLISLSAQDWMKKEIPLKLQEPRYDWVQTKVSGAYVNEIWPDGRVKCVWHP